MILYIITYIFVNGLIFRGAHVDDSELIDGWAGHCIYFGLGWLVVPFATAASILELIWLGMMGENE